MAGLVGLLVILNFGAVFAGNKLLHAKSKSLTSLKLDNKVLDEQQNSIKQAKSDIDKYSDLESIAKAVVPQDKDQAETVREIVKIAKDNDIVLGSVSFPASTLGQIAPKATSTDDKTTTPKVTTPPLTQVTAVDGIKGVYSLQVNILQDTTRPVAFQKFINFLTALEKNRRTAQVTSITVTPNPTDRSKLTFSLTVSTYIKP